MSVLLSTATVAPLAAGWSLHIWWMGRRIDAARRDPLTGLHTRSGFTRHALRVLRRGPALVLLADVNGFKQTNDAHGHAAGDALLVALASRLSLATPGGVVGRLGGDEFAAVLPDPGGDVSLSVLRETLCRPVVFDGRTLPLSVSLGGAQLSGPPKAVDLLTVALRRADEAMYTAKRTTGTTHTLNATNGGTEFASVNGRRLGRPGTHQPNGGPR